MDTQANTHNKPDLAKIRKRIKDRERRFKKMSPERKRVAIAKDVLAQIEAEKIRPHSGNWVGYDLRSHPGEAQLQDVVADLPSCSACALGAIFLCAVQRADEFTVNDAWGLGHSATDGWRVLNKYLRQFFDTGQLKLIECAFEMGQGYFGDSGYGRVSKPTGWQEAAEFGARACQSSGCDTWEDRHNSSKATQRLVAIMENIIANKGEFKP